MGARILVVEDEPQLRALLRLYLEREGHQVTDAGDGPSALAAYDADGADLVVLDLMLPGMQGETVLEALRDAGAVPVLITSAKRSDAERIAGLRAGADDYLAKPFHVEELVARVGVQLRKHHGGAPTTVGDLTLDAMRKQVWWAGTEVKLSPRELDLLAFLAGQPGRVYSRVEIERNVWGEDLPPTSNVVDVHVANIRSKLRDAGGFGVIRTVRGVGYAIKG